MTFELAEENLVMNKKDNSVSRLRTIDLDWPLGNLVFSRLACMRSKLHLLGKYLF